MLFLGVVIFYKRSLEFKRFALNIGAPYLGLRLAYAFSIGLVVWLVIGIHMGTLGSHPFSWKGYYTQADDEILEFFAPMTYFYWSLLDLRWKS